jgi:phenylacetate-coenzyme A ligase PaaK-like adenylate-forming protein
MRRLNPFVAASVQSLSFLQPRADLMDALQRLRPTVLSTYPGVAVQLAEEAASGRLHLPLKEVRTGGETLTPAARRFVAEAFGCSVINSYGASEFFCIAFECRLGCLHLNSDWVILEPVDDRGQPVPRGQAGHTTLLTNLANHVQPLIRYDLGDRVGIQAAACGCGSPLPVITVDGRCDDSLRLGSGRSGCVSIEPLALTSLLEEAGLFDFQVIQRGPLELELRLRSRAGGPAQQAAGSLAAFLARQGAGDVRIVCTSRPPVQGGANCKTRRVVALAR